MAFTPTANSYQDHRNQSGAPTRIQGLDYATGVFPFMSMSSGGVVDTAVTGTVATTQAPADTLGQGDKDVTTAGTAEALASSTACNWVVLQPKDTNTTDHIFYGSGAGAAMKLYVDDQVLIPVDNLSKVFVDVGTNGDGVNYFYGVVT